MNKRPIDVLIAEDDEFIRDIYKTKLSQSSLKDSFMMVKNGREALDALKEVYPRFMILDIFMPVMDGLQALKAIRAKEEFDDIHILVLTNFGETEYRDKMMSLGATQFLVKVKYTPAEVIAKIEDYFKTGNIE